MNKTLKLTKWMKRCWLFFAVLLLCFAILFSIFRALTPWARQYKGDLEQHLSALLGKSVTIHGMETSWYWFEPVLRLNEVNISDGYEVPITLNKLLVGVNLFSSLRHWQIQPGILYVDDLHVTLRETEGQWQIDGLEIQNQATQWKPEQYLPLLSWLTAQQKIKLKNISAMVHLQDGSLLPLDAMQLTIVNRSGHYRIKGSARLAQTMETKLTFLATMQLPSENWHKASGELYLAATDVIPSQWQGLLPLSAYRMKGGQGDFEVWLDMSKGKVHAIQSRVKLSHLAWQNESGIERHFIRDFGANLAWTLTKDGWRLSADQIKLALDGKRWPDNQMLLSYQASADAYHLFVETLFLKPLLDLKQAWPKSIAPLLQAHPDAELRHTQIGWQAQAFTYLLTEFRKLGWDNIDHLPSVGNLAGVLYWQPAEGRLELDSEHSWVMPEGLPRVELTAFNVGLNWKTLSHGLRISLDRFVLVRPDLVVSADGVLDKVDEPDEWTLSMGAAFSGDNAERWLSYIPERYLKPKLNHWLKKEVRRIEKVSGQLEIDGRLSDFPFDQSDGIFSINSHLKGVDLYINKRWPLSRGLEADLRFDERTLEADLVQGWLLDVPIQQMNLRIDDIGYDHELLLMHGKTNTPAKNALALVEASPLKRRLSKLQSLELDGEISLDLRLEIPLYPENDQVLARGRMTFDDNPLNFHHSLGDIALTDLSGTLDFTEAGIKDSSLKADLWNIPVTLRLRSLQKPKPYIDIDMKGHATVDDLKETIQSPVWRWLDGGCFFETQLKLTDDPNDLDHLALTSTLEGLSVTLPTPFGKSASERLPLKLLLDFNPDKATYIDVDYGKRFTAKARQHADDPWQIDFKEASIEANLIYQPPTHTLRGHIKRLHLDGESFLKQSSRDTKGLAIEPDSIPNLRLTIDALEIGTMQLGQVFLKSTSFKALWQLDDFVIRSPGYELTMQGKWRQLKDKDETEVQGQLKLYDLSESLKQWNVTPVVEAHQGQVAFEAAWPGPVYDLSLKTLHGQVNMLLKDGRITNLSRETEEKLGLGKLLSILSLKTIPRRLKLDFSDLSNDGYSYDIFKGNFKVQKGVMSTKDSYIDGPVAFASMQGDLDIVRRLYDLNLRVSPHITASLPVVATIAGGPIAGIATWVASKLINHGMQKISGYTYKITGPWLNPVVQQVSIIKKVSDQ